MPRYGYPRDLIAALLGACSVLLFAFDWRDALGVWGSAALMVAALLVLFTGRILHWLVSGRDEHRQGARARY